MSDLRIGLGTDLHCLEANLPLVIGGVSIPSPVGCRAHSDGDVLIHALIDALFGACGQSDIGDYFPPSDPQYKGISSLILLQHCLEIIHTEGFSIVNIDCVISLEQPKLFLHKQIIRKNLAHHLALSIDRIGVKAKSNEAMDAIGQSLAIGAQVIVLLQKENCITRR